MQKTQLVLKFSLPYYIEFPVGTKCEWMNQTFYLGCPANFKKNGQRNFEYTLNMGTLENGMADYKLHNTVDGRLKWSMCAKPEEFIKEIVKNLNERDGEGTWKVGKDCIDAPEKTVEFNHTYIDAALQSVADAFETEWEIKEDLTISLHKVEYFKDNPLALSYGRGNGFIPGVGRASQSDEKPIKRLYVEGTDRNIDRATYGAAELRLPKGKTLKYDGSHFEGEDGFVEANAHTYTSNADGTCIERTDKPSLAVKEDSLDCTEIYPSRKGAVTSLIAVDAAKNFYDIVDSNIPADLDFSSYIIPGETMTMIFQSGMLAGKEFEVAYYHEAKTVNGVEKAGRRFEIKPQEFDGVMMPNETFKPVAGGDDPDRYAIFGIQLPQEYICNDADKSGASWEMFKEAARHLFEHEEQKFTFTGELQGLWAKRNWTNVGGRLKVGGYVLFTDEQFAKDGSLIRITGIKDYLTAPYSPNIEISNSISGSSSISKNLRSIDQTEVVIKDTEERMRQFTRRRFRDAKETVAMLDEAMLDNFNNAISPAAVQTMAMLVGDESLQFQFVQPVDTEQEDGSTKRTWQRVDDTIQYTKGKRLHIGHCFIEHLTLGIDTIKANRDGEEYKHWEMEEYESPVLGKPDKKYYLYAAVSKTTSTGTFVLSSKAIPFNGENGSDGDVAVSPSNYYLLVGVLNSEYANERSFASLYGFTEILPGRITTGKIVSNDGSCYFDLENNEIGGAIKFLSGNGYITLIDGGYINTKLINASELVANHIIAGDKDGQRVEITPENKAVEIYDENGELCVILEGKQYKSLADHFRDSGSDNDGVKILTRSENLEKFGYGKNTTWGRGKVTGIDGIVPEETTRIAISQPWSTGTPMELTAQGNFAAHAYSVCDLKKIGGSNSSLGSTSIQNQLVPVQMSLARIEVSLWVETYSDETLTKRINRAQLCKCSASANASSQKIYIPDNIGQKTMSDRGDFDKFLKGTAKTPAGHHVLALCISCESLGHSSNSISAEWGFTSGTKEDISASYKFDFYVSRYFANGFCLGTRKDSYIMSYKDGENGMAFVAENKNAGFKISHEGLNTKMGGEWMPLPLPVFSAKVSCTSSNASIANCISFDGKIPTVSRAEQGTVAIQFPEQWNDLGISDANCFVVLTGMGNKMKGTLESYFTSSNGVKGIRIQISDDDTTNDNASCWVMLMMRKYPA